MDKKKKRISELEEITQEKNFWKDYQQAGQISQEIADLKEEIKFWDDTEKELKELVEDLNELEKLKRLENKKKATAKTQKLQPQRRKDLAPSNQFRDFAVARKLSKKSVIQELEKELEDRYHQIEEKIKKAEIKALFSGKYDRKNAIVSIYSGAGGTEAQDWANMLLRMYNRYAESHNFKPKILDISYGQEAGIKNAIMEISGPYAYGYLKGENGVHRLVRLSPFNADNLRHTSFALVEVLPEITEDVKKEIEIKPDDLKIDTFRASGPGGQNVNKRATAVRITYLPTKIAVSCQSERSQAQNRERAMKLLYTRLYQKKLKEKEREKAEIRGEVPSVEWGSQIRSYILHPYKMVKDHRTGIESPDPEKVLDGDLDRFVEAEIRLVKS